MRGGMTGRRAPRFVLQRKDPNPFRWGLKYRTLGAGPRASDTALKGNEGAAASLKQGKASLREVTSPAMAPVARTLSLGE